LEGITVLDMTRYLAGPACTRLLVELGADVIKIEHPPYGDPNRSNAPRINRRAGAHIQQNRGKRSVALDFNTDEGQEILRRIVPHVDVVVENFSPGVLARRNLAWDDLSAIKPDLVMASISGFGQSGSMAPNPCFDLIAQGWSGLMHMTGDPDGPPMFVGMGLADTNTGVHAFAAIGHALFHRERTGRGTHLDIAMIDSMFHMQHHEVTTASMDPDHDTMRAGTDFPQLSPAGAFKAPQGWVVILVTEGQVANLWQALGRPELSDDPRFQGSARMNNREVIRTAIEEWMATFDTDQQVLDALSANRVPAGPALSPRDALTHPWFLERGLVRTVHDPRAGAVQIPGFPFRSSDPLPPDDYQAPALGEHNRAVLIDMLGMSEADVCALEDSGVLTSKDW